VENMVFEKSGNLFQGFPAGCGSEVSVANEKPDMFLNNINLFTLEKLVSK
jgi:hypothetical protein